MFGAKTDVEYGTFQITRNMKNVLWKITRKAKSGFKKLKDPSVEVQCLPVQQKRRSFEPI